MSCGKHICTYRSLLFYVVLGFRFCARLPLSIIGDGAVIMADTIWDRESCSVPRGVGRVRHDDVKKAMFLLIPIVRNGAEKGGENFPQTGDVFIGGLADYGFENL